MASSRSSPPAERHRGQPRARAGVAEAEAAARRGPAPAANPVVDAVRAALIPLLAARSPPVDAHAPLRIAVALSGGRDSMVLLDVLAALASAFPLALTALHVHHGLSRNADAWAAFCAEECARRGVALTVRRVRVARVPGESLEAAARAARTEILAAADADAVALAHHADDQAETVLLQLLRGAGPHGLAAMAAARSAGACAFVRPLLAVPRAEIEAYARQCGVTWIDDESNADTRIKRNYLRHEIAPRLAAAFPGYPATLVRAAAHQAEAAQLQDALAALDAAAAGALADTPNPTLERAALIALARQAPARARNLLRWFIRCHALPIPSTARLSAMLAQLSGAAPDARVRLAHAGVEIGIHRGRIIVHPPPIGRYEVRWVGERALALPHGTLHFGCVADAGLSAARVAALPVMVRPRVGGEQLRLAGNRPRRPLKSLLQEAGVPAWQRDGWPLIWCGDALAAVPGIGVAAEFRASAGAQGYEVQWRPSGA